MTLFTRVKTGVVVLKVRPVYMLWSSLGRLSWLVRLYREATPREAPAGRGLPFYQRQRLRRARAIIPGQLCYRKSHSSVFQLHYRYTRKGLRQAFGCW